MEIVSKKEKIIDLFKLYITDLVLLLIFWGGILRTNYNADTLTHIFRDDADVWVRIGDARYVIALFDYILLQFGIRTTDYIRVFEGGALLIYALSMVFLQLIFAKWKPKERVDAIGYQMVICTVYLNSLFAEQLMFTEMSIYIAVAYLMATVASWCYVKKKMIWAFVCMLVAACTYQYSVIFATVVLLFYILLDNEWKLSLRIIGKYCCAGIFCFGSGLIDLLSIKILSFYGIIPAFRKSVGVGNWQTKIGEMRIALTKVFSSCYGLLPHLWLPLIMLIFPLAIALMCLLRRRKLVESIHLILVILISGVAINVLPLMNATYTFPGRMAFSVFLIIGLMYVATYSLELSEKVNDVMSYFILGILLVNMLFIHFTLEDRFTSNTLDETYASMVIDEIEKYENETGNVVTKVSVAYDNDSRQSYDRVNFSAEQINERILYFAPVFMLQYVSDREFERLFMDEETKSTFFLKNDWDEMNLNEQLVCIDDTAYWCIF